MADYVEAVLDVLKMDHILVLLALENDKQSLLFDFVKLFAKVSLNQRL